MQDSMANIRGELVSQVQDGKLAVACRYNNYGSAGSANQNAIEPYLSVPGLPSLQQPLMVNNARDVSGAPIGNGLAAIMPPGVCFSFDVGYICSLGFSFQIILQPVNLPIRDNNWYYWFLPPGEPSLHYANISQWSDGSLITVNDAQFAGAKNLTPAQRSYVENSFQIRIDTWPMTKMVTSDNRTYVPAMAPTGAASLDVIPEDSLPDKNVMPPPGTINTHHGTVGRGDSHDFNGTSTKLLEADQRQKTSIVFDILVINEKYYNHNNLLIT